VTAGQTAAFTAAATGSPTPTVQWQVSTSGGAFSNVSGATSTTLSFTTASSQNGNQYQAVFTNSAGSATTTAATLTANAAPPPSGTGSANLSSTVQQLTGNVRLMTQGTTSVPTPGTLLAQVAAQDGVVGSVFCRQFAETLVMLLTGQHISARTRTMSFDGNSQESHVTAEYYDPGLAKWVVADADFGVVYWNASTSSGMSMEDISAAVAAQNWSYLQGFVTYATTNGSLYAHNYYMDPILLYLNPTPAGQGNIQLPLPNSPEPFFTVHADTDIGNHDLWVFSFANQTDRVMLSGGTQLGPVPGTIYSQAIWLSTGWSITSRPSGLRILTINRYLYP